MYCAEDEIRLRGLIPAMQSRLPRILLDVQEQLSERHPEYAKFLDEESEGVVAAASGFIGRLLGLSDPERGPGSDELGAGMEKAVFEEIGRIHHRQGQDIAGLLAAYRIGAAVAWRHVADQALAVGVSTEAFADLAGAVFAAVDNLSSTTLHGYMQEQSDVTPARAQLRNELAELLLSDRSGTAAVRAAAARAGWTLPREMAVVLVEPDNEIGRVLLARLPDGYLQTRKPGALVAIVPDPDGPRRRGRLAISLRGARAVIGATVAPDQLPASLAVAELAARLLWAGALHDDPLFVDQHLAAAIVHGNERLLADLRHRFLAPLATLTGSARDRLEETLRSWLMNLGNHRAMAHDLHVHPKTVHYRMGRLRELFGAALDDPPTRAALLLALAWGPALPDVEIPAPVDVARSGAFEDDPPRRGKSPSLG